MSASKKKTPALDPYQSKALDITKGPLLIIAGPGSGKTRVLIHRTAHFIQEELAKPEECLTITSSQRAAQEIKERLQKLLPNIWRQAPVTTFHALGWRLLQENRSEAGLPKNFRLASPQEWADLVKSKKNTSGWLDKDALLLESIKLLEEHPGIRAKYQRLFKSISVDDFQEIDALQYRLLRLLAPSSGNLCAAGDPDQAMDHFQGEDAGYFSRFKQDFPAGWEIHLNRNYRSGEILVSASNQMTAPGALAKDRLIETLAEDPGKIMLHESPTDKAEAEYLADCINQMMGGLSFYAIDTKRTDSALEKDFSFSDFAVLYRTEPQALLLEEAFERAGIPFERRSQRSLSEHPRVQAYLALMKNSPAQEGLLEALHNARLRLPGEEDAPIYKKLETIALKSGEKKEVFLSEVYLSEDLELWDPRADRVTFLTLHAAKGLEFPVIFIAGCEEGLIPLKLGEKISGEAAREEQLLFYAGMTRAKERLLLSYAKKRFVNGELRDREASAFLKNIDPRLFEKSKALFKEKRKNPQLELF